MTVEAICRDLEQLLSDIAFSGICNVQPAIMKKLEILISQMQAVGMDGGARLGCTLKETVQDYHLGEAPVQRPVALLCALECYEKNILGRIIPEAAEENEEESMTYDM